MAAILWGTCASCGSAGVEEWRPREGESGCKVGDPRRGVRSRPIRGLKVRGGESRDFVYRKRTPKGKSRNDRTDENARKPAQDPLTVAPVRSTPPSLQIIRRAVGYRSRRQIWSRSSSEYGLRRGHEKKGTRASRDLGRVRARARDGVRSLLRGSLARRRRRAPGDIPRVVAREHVPGDARASSSETDEEDADEEKGPLLGGGRVRPPARAAEAARGDAPRASSRGAEGRGARWPTGEAAMVAATFVLAFQNIVAKTVERRVPVAGGVRPKRRERLRHPRDDSPPQRRGVAPRGVVRGRRRRARWDPPSSRAEALFGPRGWAPVLRPRRRGSVAFYAASSASPTSPSPTPSRSSSSTRSSARSSRGRCSANPSASSRPRRRARSPRNDAHRQTARAPRRSGVRRRRPTKSAPSSSSSSSPAVSPVAWSSRSSARCTARWRW